MKRGGKAKKTIKQKQSVVIKNVINIGERKRMNKRQKRARKPAMKDGRQATGGGGGMSGAGALFNPVGVQFPYQKLFQVPPNQVRSLTMSSANSNEASNNVSALIDKSQQISEGRIKSYINNALEFNAIKRMVDSEAVKQPFSINQPFIEEVESELDYEEYEEEKEPRIKKEPAFPKKRVLDKTPIDLTVDEPLYEDMGVVEDVSAEEKKDKLLAPVDKREEQITAPVSEKKLGRPKLDLTEEEIRQKKKEKSLRDSERRRQKKKRELEKTGQSALEMEYGITPPK